MNEDESKIETINIQLLKPHPRNKEIYGQEDIIDLAESIKKNGLKNPLLVNKDNVVISGHRRMYACIYLELKEVPIKRVDFKDENEELERLLLENEYREKTLYQKSREAEVWEDIEKVKAKKRMLATQNNNSAKSAMVIGTEQEKGTTRDIVAKKAGISSGSTYKRAKYTIKGIDKLIKQGKIKEANFLIAVLNKNARAAVDFVKNNLVEEIPEELKDKVIKKEIQINKAVSQIRKYFKETNNNIEQNIPKVEMKVCKQCEQEKPIYDFYEGKNICKDCCIENRNKSRNPKDVYGNEIKIDKEKIKGIDIDAIIADVKDTNKNINTMDYNSISMEFTCNIDMFIQNISKYIEMEEQFEDMQNEDKKEITDSIASIEEVINKIKGFLY